jgi:hypothetical protein
MQFGYFTLSDNHYVDNTRPPNQFIADIVDEALYAEQVGMHSAWIGEHHFSTLGVLSCPDLALAYIAARTQRIRLAPAVTVLPLHHPIRVAEQWASLDLLSGGRVDFAAGRGYDRREYAPLGVSFEDNQSILDGTPRDARPRKPAETVTPSASRSETHTKRLSAMSSHCPKKRARSLREWASETEDERTRKAILHVVQEYEAEASAREKEVRFQPQEKAAD